MSKFCFCINSNNENNKNKKKIEKIIKTIDILIKKLYQQKINIEAVILKLEIDLEKFATQYSNKKEEDIKNKILKDIEITILFKKIKKKLKSKIEHLSACYYSIFLIEDDIDIVKTLNDITEFKNSIMLYKVEIKDITEIAERLDECVKNREEEIEQLLDDINTDRVNYKPSKEELNKIFKSLVKKKPKNERSSNESSIIVTETTKSKKKKKKKDKKNKNKKKKKDENKYKKSNNVKRSDENNLILDNKKKIEPVKKKSPFKKFKRKMSVTIINKKERNTEKKNNHDFSKRRSKSEIIKRKI